MYKKSPLRKTEAGISAYWERLFYNRQCCIENGIRNSAESGIFRQKSTAQSRRKGLRNRLLTAVPFCFCR